MESKYNIENNKREIDELIEKIDKMIQEGKSENEIDELIRRLKVLLKSYLEK